MEQIRIATGCLDLAIGWASTSESKRKLLTIHGLNFSDLPALVYTNPVTRCAAFYKGKASLVMTSGFITEARSGALCNRTFYAVYDDNAEGTESVKLSEGAIGPPNPGKEKSGVGFTFWFMGIGFAIVQLARWLVRRRELPKNILD
jgi:hypothetical protein